MSDLNLYGAEFEKKDHPKRVAHQVKQYRGTGKGGAKQIGGASESGAVVLRRLLPAAVALGAVLSLIIAQ